MQRYPNDQDANSRAHAFVGAYFCVPFSSREARWWGSEQMMLGFALKRELVKTLFTMSDQVKDDFTKVKIFGGSKFVKGCEKLKDTVCAAEVFAKTKVSVLLLVPEFVFEHRVDGEGFSHDCHGCGCGDSASGETSKHNQICMQRVTISDHAP